MNDLARARRGWRGARLAIALIALAVLAPVLYVYWLTHVSDGELTEKAVWAMLQGQAMDARSNAQPGPLLHRQQGYVALGVPGRGAPLDDQGTGPASTRMWIVLNDHSASQTLRQTNRFSGYDLECAYVRQLPGSVPDVDSYVLAYLRAICR